MKQFLIHTTSLLRTALLLGAMALLNFQTATAQTASLPDAFDTYNPADIIGDGNYYYIQFYEGSIRSYLTDCGVSNKAWAKDFLPYTNNRLWTLVSVGVANQFKLKSKEGHYLGFSTSGTTNNRYVSVANYADATTFVFNVNGDGYDISDVSRQDKMLYRPTNHEWTDLADVDNKSYNKYLSRLRFVKLKSNSAFIIYYREEGLDDNNSGAETTRHYLTYSGTDDERLDGTNLFWHSDVSSQQSIIPKNMALSALPTAAAYHKDGLWSMEPAEVDGQFYIKRYDNSKYLNKHNHNGNYDCVLEDTPIDVYTFETPDANRYTRIRNVANTNTTLYHDALGDMFKQWENYGKDKGVASSVTIENNIGQWVNGGATVIGTGGVDFLTYADLSEYQKMTINGTEGMQLRVLMSRQESNNGPMVEKLATIGSNGTAVVDLTDLHLRDVPDQQLQNKLCWPEVKMTYINGSDTDLNTSYGEVTQALCGYNSVSNTTPAVVGLANKGWGWNYIIYLQVDASTLVGTRKISKATLRAKASSSKAGNRATVWGAGYSSLPWSADLTWNNTGDHSITVLPQSNTVSIPASTPIENVTDDNLELDITRAFTDNDDRIVTIVVYETEAGGADFVSPWVEIEYTPDVSDVIIDYAHLNAIKTNTAGTVNSITLSKESDINYYSTLYLHHAEGDGWQALQWPENDARGQHWYAGFYPVEVVDKDNFYQAVLMKEGKMLGTTKGKLKDYNAINLEGWTVEQTNDYQHFKLKNSAGQYYKSNEVVTTDASEAKVFTIYELTSEANAGFYTSQFIPKTETRILHDVTHKGSNIRLFYTYGNNNYSAEQQKLYAQQGLVTNDNDDWTNADGTQKVNEFKITHYVKKGDQIELGLPTTLGSNNDHRLYQRWYNYKNDTDLDGLKRHVSLKTSAGEVMSYMYNNGVVTGEKLDWQNVNIFPGANTYESHLVTYSNPDGDNFTLAADVSRYSDFTYKNTTSPLDGDLEEPTLTMRYIYYMKDAKVMANMLMANKVQTGSDEDKSKWLEYKTIHFPATRVFYENSKRAQYQGEFLGIYHTFRDYWVFNGGGTEDANLVSAVEDGGKIEVVVDANGTDITLGGYGNKGYYLYDEGKNKPSSNYGDSRYVAFKYPSSGTVSLTGDTNPAYLRVYFKVDEYTKYQIAKFILIFDENSETLPWTSVNGSNKVQGTSRDPKNLEAKAGKPIAKITFDYPINTTYRNASSYNIHNKQVIEGYYPEIANSSPLPLRFEKTNYGFDGEDCSWGSYALVSQSTTQYGNKKTVLPANHSSYGYNIATDSRLESAFLYIDASEQPGDICYVDFTGEFCSQDKLMCSGWISGANKVTGDDRCAGSVTITVKGERTENGEKVEDDIYRFCPGQCYELDNGTGGVDGSEGSSHVVWQQFYFEFSISRKYERHWVEVNNNCVSSTGGDFMLDNIEVYALVPEAIPEMNSPICINKDASEMQLLKITLGFDKIISAIGATEVTGDAAGEVKDYSFVFLEKDVFLKTFQSELSTNNSINKTIAELESIIKTGEYGDKVLTDYSAAYQAAFNAAVLGDPTKIWNSNTPETNTDAAVLNFRWNTNFSKMESYTFAKAVNKKGAVFSETVTGTGERLIVMNGNYPQLPWKINTDYYIVPYISGVTSLAGNALYEDFNIFSTCNRRREFQIKPPLNILSMDSPDKTTDLEVCEGKIPTLVTELNGYTINGNQVPLTNLSFDWWLGDLSSNPKVIATLENYHAQTNDAGTVRLDEALGTFRIYYPEVTSLDGVTEVLTKTPHLTLEMIYYLQELVTKGQLVLHQSSISIPAEKAADDDPYFYVVACPIHDGYFDQALNNGGTTVAYFCDEPQGLRMKVIEKAPSLKCGFVPNENGYASYAYPTGNTILSIRLAKKAQFETVKHGDVAEAPKDWENNSDLNYLWLPIRDAKVQTTNSTKVIVKSDDYNVYLASTDDPVLDKTISTEMAKTRVVDGKEVWIGSLPIVGKIVKLNAIDTDKNSGTTEKDENRLCIYFTENFDVREGYSYTLSLPFKENETYSCDGTLLLHLKIVPDYEVWTGGAGSTDWNNDQNWRRADGNLTAPSQETTDGSGLNNNELLVSASLPATSQLKGYTTNYDNYRTATDRLLRKGFAPLYCTHILMKSNEWGDAPVLYDALNGKGSLDAAPFPNLSESYDVYSMRTVVDQRFETVDALSGQSFAIVNESDGKALYGTTVQNLGYADYYTAMQETNTGCYFKIENGPDGKYLFRLQTPEGNDYRFHEWGRDWDGYLNSQPFSGTVSFILGLSGWDNSYTYGQDGNNLALWEIVPDGNGKFALKNVGTGNKYLKDNSNAKYDEPTWFTFCTLKKETVTTTNVKDNILKYDMQARIYDKWNETYGANPDKGRTGDLIAEMYQINNCDEIAMQPSTELLNAHLLNYNSAWVEYELDNKRWYLLGSSLQGTISGEWYAPTGTAQQKTTYYEPVTFGEGYDRYSPAIYQRSWDKAKAVLYEIGSTYSTGDDSQTENLGSSWEGHWNNGTWKDPTEAADGTGADEYLDRLGYKPMGGKKANVAIEGIWSNTYNDATVDYANGGFSVMVLNHLRGNDQSGDKAIIRLPKEDTMYDYYQFGETGAVDGGTDTNIRDVQTKDRADDTKRATNRGRLKTDLLLPTYTQKQEKVQDDPSNYRYGDRRTLTRVPTQVGTNALPMTLRSLGETVSAGASGLAYYLVENPFQSGLKMNEFFAENTELEKKYWLLTSTGQHLVQQAATGDWKTQAGGVFAADEAVLAPGQGFFVEATTLATTPGASATITFTSDMQAQTRFGQKSDNGTSFDVVVGKKQKMTTKQETITMDNGSTQTVTVEVPETDGSGNYVLEDTIATVTIYNYVQDTGSGKVFPLKARTRGEAAESELPGLVITAQRGESQSSALVMQRSEASNDFRPEEDTETFINSDLKNVPTVYTLCGRLATTINSIHDFRSLPVGVESSSDAPCTLTFDGVETLGDSIAFYDAVEQKLTPLKSGMQFSVSGRTQNRYYLVRSLMKEEAAEETHLRIFTQGLTAKVIASTAEPITNVRCYDTAGRQVHAASPQTSEYGFHLPTAGIYIIVAETDNDRKTVKLIAK